MNFPAVYPKSQNDIRESPGQMSSQKQQESPEVYKIVSGNQTMTNNSLSDLTEVKGS